MVIENTSTTASKETEDELIRKAMERAKAALVNGEVDEDQTSYQKLSAMVAEIERLTGVAASWREEAWYHLQRTEEAIQQTEEAEKRIKAAQRRLARFSW
ncbi:hypothetical protein LH462_08360 [Laribacter hongkongensis]|uniref:Uncharacterized protein n=1 Tax=Laribacter hongkongensis TaxID=168471 RepID=A0ABD4ST26_9NEIS|nr:hypothetical protein [Laribacter hongkongensis]MCG9025696.1 hypothetical protein [Laribacter hongkongensis]MCG9101251.1 hypothetical protein [Laribacter hongkongensis]MCG9103732.1 hypothetical protein [Laribacter hongkongensis]MCG9112835.1 hypothetical protein [Laribacter hongkongensis]MCG9118892.1 hypothetical protein [Laribacter hongkongensis]